MKQISKKIIVCCLLVSLCFASMAQAAYVTTSDSHNMGNGHIGNVNLSMDDSYATASSYANTGLTYASVSLSFKYGWGTGKYTVSGNGTGTTRPVTVTKNSQHAGSVAISADSSHVVETNSVTWSPSLHLGL